MTVCLLDPGRNANFILKEKLPGGFAECKHRHVYHIEDENGNVVRNA